ncbi:hypothetical protein HGRIS_007178 [Hohenbuehelia grisea]|uniref:Dyp-type peroxidase n=1 Tax=Hohenbuehelia grisea TaxID=104357 RepID=A0ABR3JBW2_9AGAR
MSMSVQQLDLPEQFAPPVDEPFDMGQLRDAPSLNDIDTEKWDPVFNDPGHLVHVLITVTGDTHATVEREVAAIDVIFEVGTSQASLTEVKRIRGDVRPGDQAGHEHFGYLDGISNPPIEGVPPTPNCVPPFPRTFVLFSENDPGPVWARDGSFLVFRYLFQLVPEFDDYLLENAHPGMPKELGSKLLGAKLVGRWKSGAPIDLSPTEDNPDLALRNDFLYEGPGNERRCPLGAHIRKTYPRDDTTTPSPILRRGIPFGPEVTPEERAAKKTLHDRGLLFVCYQRSIASGFRTVQRGWANDTNFPKDQTGFDPIIGRCGAGRIRTMRGTHPDDMAKEISFPTEFVVPRGGEYFFSPSIRALGEVIALSSDPPRSSGCCFA